MSKIMAGARAQYQVLIFAWRLNGNHAYFAVNIPTSNGPLSKRATASLYFQPAFSSPVFTSAALTSFAYFVPASRRFSYPSARSMRAASKNINLFFVLSFRAIERGRSSIQTVSRTRTLPGCRLPGCCLGTIRYSRRAMTAQPPSRRAASDHLSLLCLPLALASLANREYPVLSAPALVLSVSLLPADERRRQTPFLLVGGTRRNPFERRRPPGCLPFRRRRTGSHTIVPTHTYAVLDEGMRRGGTSGNSESEKREKRRGRRMRRRSSSSLIF